MAGEEITHLLAEYRERIAPGGMPTPVLDRVAAHVEGTVPPLPDGSRTEPLRWGGLLAAAAGMAASGLALRRWRRRR